MSFKSLLSLACLFLLSDFMVNGELPSQPFLKNDQQFTSQSDLTLSRTARDIRNAVLGGEDAFSGNRVKRQLQQLQRMTMGTMAPMGLPSVADLSQAMNINRKPSYVSSVSQSHAQHIDTKNPTLQLADALAFTLDIQGPLGDSSSEYKGNQNFGKGATSSANSKGGSGQSGGPALAAADTSADITGVDPDSIGKAATINKATVFISGNGGGVSNARGSVGNEAPQTAPAVLPGQTQSQSQALPPQNAAPGPVGVVPVPVPAPIQKSVPITSVSTTTVKTITVTTTTISSTSAAAPVNVAPVDQPPTVSSDQPDSPTATNRPDGSVFVPDNQPRRFNHNREREREREEEERRHHRHQFSHEFGGSGPGFFPPPQNPSLNGFGPFGSNNGGLPNNNNGFPSSGQVQGGFGRDGFDASGRMNNPFFGASSGMLRSSSGFPNIFGSNMNSFGSNNFASFGNGQR